MKNDPMKLKKRFGVHTKYCSTSSLRLSVMAIKVQKQSGEVREDVHESKT